MASRNCVRKDLIDLAQFKRHLVPVVSDTDREGGRGLATWLSDVVLNLQFPPADAGGLVPA